MPSIKHQDHRWMQLHCRRQRPLSSGYILLPQTRTLNASPDRHEMQALVEAVFDASHHRPARRPDPLPARKSLPSYTDTRVPPARRHGGGGAKQQEWAWRGPWVQGIRRNTFLVGVCDASWS